MRGFSRFLIDEQPLYVLPTLACVVGLPEAIFLQQLHHWCTSRFAHEHGGRHWVYNSYPEWSRDHFPFWSEQAVRRIIAELERLDVVVGASLSPNKMDRRKWYTIDYERLDALCEDWLAAHPESRPRDPETGERTHLSKATDRRPESTDAPRRGFLPEASERTHPSLSTDHPSESTDHPSRSTGPYKGRTETTAEKDDRDGSSSTPVHRPADNVVERDATWLRPYMTDFAKELGDEAALPVSLALAANLWLRSGLDEDAFAELLYEARRVTQRRTPGIERRRGDERKNKMPYFFQVLEDLLARRRGDST
jgi:hypothetical protein